MKNLIALLSIVLISTVTLQAQNIDRNEMKQDINILEGVLNKLFKTSLTRENGTLTINKLHVSKGDLTWNFDKNDKIEGTYIPSYGVLFTIRKSNPVVVFDKNNDDYTGYYFTHTEDGQKKAPINKKTIINRMLDFLKNYSSTLNQLGASNKITIVYKGKDFDKLIKLIGDLSKSVKDDENPTISVTTTMKDVKAYQNGNINSNTFRNRLKININKPQADGNDDLKIMTSILKTTFEGQGKTPFNIINGQVSYLKLESFGVLYTLDLSYGGYLNSLYFYPASLDIPYDKIDIKFKKLFNTADSFSIADTSIGNINITNVTKSINTEDGKFEVSFDSTELAKLEEQLHKMNGQIDKFEKWFNQRRQKAKEKLSERRQKMQKALKDFIKKLKGYLVDYGGTLKSIEAQEQLLLTLNIHENVEDMPTKVILMIQKSVLKAAARGEISRQQAIKKIDVRKIQ